MKYLDALSSAERNFTDERRKLTRDRGWRHYASEAVVAKAPAGPPAQDGAFARARRALMACEFSDPSILKAHFDPTSDLLGRRMLLEMRAAREVHYLCGVIVSAVRSESTVDRTVFGFRYDTLEGHIERGTEWFLLTKHLDTGTITFRIEADWRPGQFPNWWSRLGFSLVGTYYQKKWHRKAHVRMAKLVEGGIQRPPTHENKIELEHS